MVPEIVVTTLRTDPLQRVRRALGGADARIPVEKDLMKLVEEALAGAREIAPSDRHFLEGLTHHKVAPLADPWDLAQILYDALCIPNGAPSVRYEEVSGICTATPELEDLFLQKHRARGAAVLAMDELRPAYCTKSFAVTDGATLEGARRSLSVLGMLERPEGAALARWQYTQRALVRVVKATEAPGTGLLVYYPA